MVVSVAEKTPLYASPFLLTHTHTYTHTHTHIHAHRILPWLYKASSVTEAFTDVTKGSNPYGQSQSNLE